MRRSCPCHGEAPQCTKAVLDLAQAWCSCQYSPVQDCALIYPKEPFPIASLLWKQHILHQHGFISGEGIWVGLGRKQLKTGLQNLICSYIGELLRLEQSNRQVWLKIPTSRSPWCIECHHEMNGHKSQEKLRHRLAKAEVQPRQMAISRINVQSRVLFLKGTHTSFNPLSPRLKQVRRPVGITKTCKARLAETKVVWADTLWASPSRSLPCKITSCSIQTRSFVLMTCNHHGMLVAETGCTISFFTF